MTAFAFSMSHLCQPYFSACNLRTSASSSTSRAMPSIGSAVTLPRAVHAATRTCGLRRIRRTFQVCAPVATKTCLRRSSETNQTGVDASVPSFRNVVIER